MEAMGAEGQWTSLSGVYTAEEADFMALLLNNQISPSMSTTSLQNFWPSHHDHHQYNHPMTTNSCSVANHNNIYTTFSRGNTSPSSTKDDNNNYSCGGSFNVFPPSSNDLSNQNSLPTSIDFFVEDVKTTINNDHNNSSYLLQGDNYDARLSSEEMSDGGEAVAPKMIKESQSAKRPRSTDQNGVEPVGKRQAKSRKKPKLVVSIPGVGNNPNEEGNYGVGAINNGASSSSACCSGDESINGGQESPDSSSLSPKEPSNLNSDAKARARRGSATDPQSLYARKRRERINERLRILQNLVPNGTKVDISTMLEEAVQYVKFLQIQIKLLSSDDLWMYAPIAYNGKELGLDHHLKLSLAKQSLNKE